LPAVFDQSFLGKFLPGEFVAPQQIFVKYEGEEYKIWEGVKRTKEENAEARGQALVVLCELSSEHEPIIINGGFYFTQCDWGAVSDER
ncbi:DUF6795 domain-containing protein, partial [Thalassolituus oleivorans]|uniref:DUF6795 domain-containing protein n=1 Tax=Thalassolituus oleivorans TaxID=187493 RepID=UPI0024098424